MSGKILYVILLFAAGVFLAAANPAKGAIVQGRSVSLADVISAIASASDGDTVLLPAGTATWTSRLTITKAITLQGSGVGRTIIRDGVQSGQFLTWSLIAGKPSRMTGIEFQNGGRIITAAAPVGVFRVAGSNTNGSTFRMDHCQWNGLNGLAVFDTVIGVVDHNTISTIIGGFFTIYGTAWNGGRWGDKSWAAPTNFGSSQFLFIEDNIYTNTSPSVRGMTDAYGGARFVVRHNTINNANINTHGTEGQRNRGVRAIEAYNNTFIGVNLGGILGNARSGVVLFHDNTISGYTRNPRFELHSHRMFNNWAYWGSGDGTNHWDANQRDGPFFAGTASGPSVGLSVTVSGNPNWAANRWTGYSVKRTTNLGGLPGEVFSEILSNTANTLTYSSSGGYAANLSFANGDSLQIWKVNHAFDQPGRSGGSLVTGNPPSPPLWNNQITEPCYSWHNTREGGAHVNFSAAQRVIKQNEHFFNDTVMPGYTTFTYPHPLTSAAPVPTPAPSAPSCSLLQQRLDRLQRRQERLERRNRSNPRLNRRIRRLQQQLQLQHC